MFQRAHEVTDHDKIPHDKGFIEHDGQRRKKVAENVLNGQRDSDTADAQASNQRSDVKSKVVDRQKDQNRVECKFG